MTFLQYITPFLTLAGGARGGGVGAAAAQGGGGGRGRQLWHAAQRGRQGPGRHLARVAAQAGARPAGRWSCLNKLIPLHAEPVRPPK